MVRVKFSGLSDRLYIGTTLVVRMAINLMVLPVLARGLGAEQFGLFATVINYATLVALVTDFGYSVKTLRDIAEAPDRAGDILSEALAAKGLLTLASIGLGAAVIAFLPLSWTDKLACVLLVAGQLGASYGDLGMVAFRAFGRYARETWITTLTLVPYLVLLTPLAFLHAPVIWVAVVFLLTRVGYMLMALTAIKKLVPTLRFQLGMPMRSVRGTSAWAMDSGFGYLLGQVDGLIIPQVLGLGAAGIYSSHARFVQASFLVGQALANIHIPRVASQEVQGRRLALIMLEFAGLGVAGAIFFIVAGPYITKWLLGPQFIQGDVLWLGLSVYLFARFVGSAFGAILSAKAAPGFRVAAQIVGLATIAVGFALFLPSYGIVAAPWIMAAGATATAAIYALAFWRLLAKANAGGGREAQA